LATSIRIYIKEVKKIMTIYYWIGSGGNISDGNHLSLSSGGSAVGGSNILTSSDSLNLNSASGTTYTITRDIPVTLFEINITPNGSISFAGTEDLICTNLNYTGAATKTGQLNIQQLTNIIVTGVLTVTGNSATNRVLVAGGWTSALGQTTGIPATISAAFVSLLNCDFQDIIATGGGAPFIGTNIGDGTGNTGITFTAPLSPNWIGTSGGGWSNSSNWSNGIVPLAHDLPNFPSNSLSADGFTITMDMPRLGTNIDFSPILHSFILSGPTSGGAIAYGNFKLSPNMTIAVTSPAVTIMSRTPNNLTTNGVTINFPMFIRAFGTVTTLQDNCTLGNKSFSFGNGVVDLNGKLLIAASSSGNVDNSRGIKFSGGKIKLTGGTGSIINWVISSVNFTVDKTGGGEIELNRSSTGSANYIFPPLEWPTLRLINAQAGTFAILGGGSWDNIICESPGQTILFSDSTSYSLGAWNLNGTAGNLNAISSFSGGNFTLNMTNNRRISADYINLSHCTTRLGYAGSHSTNSGSNPGWIFTDPPAFTNILSTGQDSNCFF
jgi:hypothetical protein